MRAPKRSSSHVVAILLTALIGIAVVLLGVAALQTPDDPNKSRPGKDAARDTLQKLKSIKPPESDKPKNGSDGKDESDGAEPVVDIFGNPLVAEFHGNGTGATDWFTVKDDWRYEWESRDEFQARFVRCVPKIGEGGFQHATGKPDSSFSSRHASGGEYRFVVDYGESDGYSTGKGPWRIRVFQGSNRIGD